MEARDRASIFLGLVAGALVFVSFFMPIWEARLEAPQYPDGLRLSVYGDRVEGDVAEVDSLNHYIGMSPIRIEDLPEIGLWPVAVGLALAAVMVSVLAGRGLPVRLARLYMWTMPLGVLATIQIRLHQYGHDLDSAAALRVGDFTPWVVGPTRVWNFTAWSRPGGAIFAMLAAACLVSFGPRLLRRMRVRRARRALVTAVLVVPLTIAGLPAFAHGATGLIDLADLLAAVPAGGTLVLEPGSYRGDVVVDRTVRIEGRDMPEIVGSGTGAVLTITAPGTVVTGVRVAGSGPGPADHAAGIRIEADDVIVEGVAVEDSYTGIVVAGVSRVRLVANAIMGRGQLPFASETHVLGDDEQSLRRGRGDGISLWHADGVLVRENVIHGVRDGVYVSFGSGALIDGNLISDSRYAVHSMYAADLVLVENRMEGNLSGAVLMYGGPVLMLRNDLRANSSPSTGFGLLLKDVVDAEVVENVVVANRVGVHLDGPTTGGDLTLVSTNTVARNQIGAVIYPSSASVFTANSFADNVVQVVRQGRRSAAESVEWSRNGVGNYWSNYQGFELGGRGALPHVEGSAVDRLLIQAPVLTPLASGPALLLMRAVESRWTELRPVFVDERPLTRPVSPRIPAPDPDVGAGGLLAGLGVMVAGLSSVVLGRMGRAPALIRRDDVS